MLDEFREQANDSPFFEEEDDSALTETPPQTRRQFLGMSPAQRFAIALMLFAITFLLSAFCLLATDRMALPFL